MTLFVGTRAGIYRIEDDNPITADLVLSSGDTLRVRTFSTHAGVFAASKTGLYHSTDRGETWGNLDVPRREVFSVVASPEGPQLFAGTHPAHLYTAADIGEPWRELTSLQSQPSRERWHTPRHRHAAHVRSLGTHPDRPARLVAGVEVGGVHVSEDLGETWAERRTAGGDALTLEDDIHHVLVIDSDTYVIACGDGLHRTENAGRSWIRLDDGRKYTYFREAFHHRGVLYAGAHTRPGTWNRNGDPVIFERRDGETGMESVPYPGADEHEFVVAWTEMDDRVVAGTTAGHLLRREDDGWMSLGSVPSSIRSLAWIRE